MSQDNSLRDGDFLETVRRLKDMYLGFPWESEIWAAQGHRRSPYRALMLFGLSPRTKDWLLVSMCRKIFHRFPTVEVFLRGWRSSELRSMVRKGQYPFLASAAEVIEDQGSRVPEDRERLMKIRGVGDKVADCVLGYGWGRESLPLDGNTLRVMERIFGPPVSAAQAKAGWLRDSLKALYNRQRPWMQSHGIGMIDLHELFRLHGQTVCVRTPQCFRCPLPECRSRNGAQMPAGELPQVPVPPQFWQDWRELLLNPLS